MAGDPEQGCAETLNPSGRGASLANLGRILRLNCTGREAVDSATGRILDENLAQTLQVASW